RQYDPFIEAKIGMVDEYITVEDKDVEALMRILGNRFEDYAKISKKVPPEALIALTSIEEPERYADTLAGYISMKLQDKQEVLEEFCVNQRLNMLIDILGGEIDILELERRIAGRVRQQMEKSQKEYYLREQIKAIQKELGEKDDRQAEVEELQAKIKKARLPKDVLEKMNKELDRLEKMPPMVAEALVVRTYIEWVTDLPWHKQTKDNTDLKEAERILNEDHYGLEKPKERILEYLASRQLAKALKGPILCLVGPPGVGKTSLARSIAKSLGRNFVRMSLGGIRDEAEIRGHRRTYIGAMPGRIITSIKQSGTKNPLFLLDEIDKMNNDFHGDPASALLEALDPEQNNTFNDHYIDLPFDLSKVMFITTANVLYDIPRPLLDRMEIIQVSSYTEEEKFHIALKHLIPKQIKEHGLNNKQLQISDNALRGIIRNYTREAGVRELERKIGKICRRVVKNLVTGVEPPFVISESNLREYLGISHYTFGKSNKEPQIGLVTGLAWTEVGGDLLEIEVQTLPGKGKMTITGQLGDVMKESAQAGFTYIRSIAAELGIDDNIEEKLDFHIHVPEGGIPKDGPSAGITMATALASQLTGRSVRPDLAMTGEITIRGRVLPVGGIKEKLLAAYRGGCTTIIMPWENEKDLEELPENVKSKLEFHFVKAMKEVLELALLPKEAADNNANAPQ
ncbi:MAG: endopeptidase La, partial [Clostridiales bacterium]